MKKLDTAELCGKYDPVRKYNMTTASGKPFWPSDPRPEDVRIEDIATHLSRICRFNGALKEYVKVPRRLSTLEKRDGVPPFKYAPIEIYSVAQHSVLVCDHVEDPALKLSALLHDAAEAYVGDMTKPVKMMTPGRKVVETKIAIAIGQAFNIDPLLFDHPDIKEQDYRAVLTEHRDLQTCTGEVDWGLEQAKREPWPERIIPVLPSVARRMFMQRFKELTNGIR